MKVLRNFAKRFYLKFVFLLSILLIINLYQDIKFKSFVNTYLPNVLPDDESSLHVFIDLGANKGDSIYNFVGINNRAQGGNLLKNQTFPQSFKSAKWIIYGFEANSVFDSRLIKMKEDVEKLNHTIHLYNSTAAWTYDGTIDFYLDTINRYHDFWGSSLNKNHRDIIRSNRTKVTVNCVDIARIINQYKPKDNIIVKMDIEGAEFDLLQDFIKKDVFELIDYIAIEFHNILSPFRKSEDVFKSLIKNQGIQLLNWT